MGSNTFTAWMTAALFQSPAFIGFYSITHWLSYGQFWYLAVPNWAIVAIAVAMHVVYFYIVAVFLKKTSTTQTAPRQSMTRRSSSLPIGQA